MAQQDFKPLELISTGCGGYSLKIILKSIRKQN
jgi:hypothetical protein